MERLQKGVNDLETWCLNNGSWGKQLMTEWTGECKDGAQYNIDGVTKASHKKFKWKCSDGHEWFAVVSSRTSRKSGCPYCFKSNQSEIASKAGLSNENSLETWCESNGAFGEQLMSEWTGICEDGKHYNMNQVAFGSNKKFRWKCSRGHEWFATVINRTVHKSSCPYCSGKRVSNENNLKIWCLNNGLLGEQLMDEWTGICEDGTHYRIDEVSRGSIKKLKWKCNKGHEWYADVLNRTSHKTDCPYCGGKRATKENNLMIWCSIYGEFGKQLIKEWTGECKDGKQYGIDEVTRGSRKIFKWICSKGHEWLAAVKDRTSQKQGCPYCAGQRVTEENSLKNWCLSNGAFGEQLMSEWTGECDDRNHYETNEVARASNKKFKWVCSNGHEWFAIISDRTGYGHGCPYCFKENQSELVRKARTSEENSLKTWCLNNSSWGQQLMSEWTGICEDGKHYSAEEIARGSRKKFKWICSKGHEWYANVVGRTSRKTGCPYCSTHGTSYPEQFIYHSLKQIYPSAENRCKVLKSPQNQHGVEFDIGIPEIPLCIEYSPTRWHEGKEERDQYKKDLCQKANVRLIQIIEDSYDELKHIKSDDYICFKMDENKKDEILEIIVDHILKSLGHSISEIDVELVKQKAYESSKGIEKDTQDTD